MVLRVETLRARVFTATILVSLLLLGGRLFALQIIHPGDAEEVSQGNALRMLRMIPPRGAVYDRHGVLMVDNEPSYTVTLTPRSYAETNTPLLAAHLEVPDSVVETALIEARNWTSYRPSRAFTDIPYTRFSRIQEDLFLLPGVGNQIDEKRRYPSSARASHVLGYVGEITREELEQQPADNPYRQGDLVGRTGVERAYDAYLRGVLGSSQRVVNVYGLPVRSYLEGQGDIPPISGYDVHLAMDAGVQALAESLFVSKRGAAVAMDATTGGIIALHSAPDYDPSMLGGKIDPSWWAAVNTDPDKPLYNRATMNLMPPGSTWKPLMALIALDTGLINASGENSTVYCNGAHPMGNGRFFRCLGVHGPQDAIQAIQNSCKYLFL